MRLDVWRQDLAVTPSLRQHVERRVSTSLNRFGSRVRHIMVRLADLNGPRGGTDKRCRIVLSLARLGEISVDATATTLPAAVDEAADRAVRAVAHTLGRRRAQRHHRELRNPRATPWWRQDVPAGW